jgi:hypothetical protein
MLEIGPNLLCWAWTDKDLLCIVHTFVHKFLASKYHVYTDNRLFTTDLLWQTTDPSSRQRGRPTWTGQWHSNKKKNLVMSLRRGSTPRRTDSPTVSCNGTLTLTLTLRELKTGCSLAESSQEDYGSKGAVLPMMIMMTNIWISFIDRCWLYISPVESVSIVN